MTAHAGSGARTAELAQRASAMDGASNGIACSADEEAGDGMDAGGRATQEQLPDADWRGAPWMVAGEVLSKAWPSLATASAREAGAVGAHIEHRFTFYTFIEAA